MNAERIKLLRQAHRNTFQEEIVNELLDWIERLKSVNIDLIAENTVYATKLEMMAKHNREMFEELNQ